MGNVPNILRYAGLAEEQSYNETATEADFHADITSSSLDVPDDTQLIYGGGLQRSPSTFAPGYYAPTGDIVFAADVDTLAYVLKWALGGYHYTADHSTTTLVEDNNEVSADGTNDKFVLESGEFPHMPAEGNKIQVSGFTEANNNGDFTVVSATKTEITVTESLVDETKGDEVTIGKYHNQHEIYGTPNSVLPSFCARLGKDNFEHIFTGCAINSFQLEAEGEFAVATLDIVAAQDAKGSIKTSDYLLPRPVLLTFKDVTVEITDGGGNIIEADDVASMTLEVNNNTDAESGRALGRRHPTKLVSGERETTMSANLHYTDTEALEAFWGNADGPANTGGKAFGIKITLDGGHYGKCVIDLPYCTFTSVNTQPSGRDRLTQEVAARAMLSEETLENNETVNSEIIATVENTVSEI